MRHPVRWILLVLSTIGTIPTNVHMHSMIRPQYPVRATVRTIIIRSIAVFTMRMSVFSTSLHMSDPEQVITA